MVALLLGGGLIYGTKMVQQNQENRSNAAPVVTKKGYAESCSVNNDCISGYCANERNTRVCAKRSSDDACTSLGGSCTVSMATANGVVCKTSDSKDGNVIAGLCYKTISKKCCLPSLTVDVGAGVGSEKCKAINVNARCVASMNLKNGDGCKVKVNGNEIDGKVVSNKCTGQYDKTARCCVPNVVVTPTPEADIGAGPGSENCRKLDSDARCIAPMSSKSGDECEYKIGEMSITGKVVIGKCVGQYNKTARCCKPVTRVEPF